jgi:hypothetical protein
MAISTVSDKAKGRKLQQHVRDLILRCFSNLSANDVVSCPMGSTGMDIWLSQAAQDAFPFSVECKARKGIALIYDALEQANRSSDLIPVAVVKADRKRPLAVMDLDVFMALVASQNQP